MLFAYLSLAIRVVVFGLFAVASIVAGAHWLVQSGRIEPFGGFARLARRLGEPFVRPLERRALRSGWNPSKAPYHLFWFVVVGGLALIALTDWLIRTIVVLGASAAAGPRGLLVFAVNGIFSVLIAAIFIRFIASWFRISPYSRPMRIVYGLTDWVIEPLRRVLPTLGPFDLSPMVAYFMLALARWVLLSFI